MINRAATARDHGAVMARRHGQSLFLGPHVHHRSESPSHGRRVPRRSAIRVSRVVSESAQHTRALKAMRSRATLVARAAPRRAANAGQVRSIATESACRARTACRENRSPESDGSPPVATGRGVSFTESSATPARDTQEWGEDTSKIMRLDRSPPVASRGAWGEENSWGASGSPPVADASSLVSQKATSAPCAVLEVGRTRTNTRHSARQASVRSSPFQQAGIRVPAAVQPGQAPRAA